MVDLKGLPCGGICDLPEALARSLKKICQRRVDSIHRLRYDGPSIFSIKLIRARRWYEIGTKTQSL